MGSENLTSIQLNYRQQGENGLLERYAQIDQVEQQLSALAGQLKTIETQLAMLDEQGAAQQVSRAGGGALLDEDWLRCCRPSKSPGAGDVLLL